MRSATAKFPFNNQSLLISALIIGGIIYMSTQLTSSTSSVRGIRNNNPMNIKESQAADIQWEGEHKIDLDPVFEEFQTPLYGLRAGARILRTYAQKYGRNTIALIIERWAPTSENDTANYTQFVSNQAQIPADKPLERAEYPRVMAAMIRMENGEQPYSMDDITKGFEWGFYG